MNSYDYDIIVLNVLYLTMSPSTITLSYRGFPGSAGRTGKISCAWRMRCLLHTFIIWFWNRISMSTKSCYKLLHQVNHVTVNTSPVFNLCLCKCPCPPLTVLFMLKNISFPVDEMRMWHQKRYKNRLDTDVYHWAKLKAEATCCKTVDIKFVNLSSKTGFRNVI